MSSSDEELGRFVSEVDTAVSENEEHEEFEEIILSESVNQSDAFLKECIARCANTSYGEHAIRAGITGISFVGSAIFFLGVWQLAREVLGDDQIGMDLGSLLGICSVVESALPLAGMGVTTAEDMQPFSEAARKFLEPTQRRKIEFVLRVIAGLASAVPMLGLGYEVLENYNPAVLWTGAGTAFIAMAFGTIPSMLSLGKSAPIELEVSDDLTAEQLATLERMRAVMFGRFNANLHKVAQLKEGELPETSIELFKLLLKEPAPSYGAGLNIMVGSVTAGSFLGMTGYAGSTGLLASRLFRSLPYIAYVLGTDVTTAFFILAFGNLMRRACEAGYTNLYEIIAAIYGIGIWNFLTNQIYASSFFPIAAPVIAAVLAILALGTIFTNAQACYAMTLPLLNFITFGYWEKLGLITTTEVLRWVTSIWGANNSGFFNGRGSISAVDNVFLLKYGHLFLNDPSLIVVLENFNGTHLYLRRLEENLPLGKAMELLEASGRNIVEDVLAEATKDENAPSITMGNWPRVVEKIKEQRLSENRQRFLNGGSISPTINSQPHERTPLSGNRGDNAANRGSYRAAM